MSEYIVSARKYRPMTFDSVVGQSSLTTTLKNAVATGKLAHAYLFCGPRGVGKTTCARIFAKVINCLSPTATGDACGECESCKAFNEGRSLNIFELDAASNNGVEHIKALMEQTRIPPQTGKYKVFIIDEVHMLSAAAFNAFLKTLEEPPAHVIFILATTEKHKILPTIISRCQIYDFERMSVPGIINHLKHVADSEGIIYEEQALNIIAEKADGGMRDALSIFDQAASFCQGNITYQKVIEDLNVLDAENYFKIIDLSLENKVADVMTLLNGILSKGFDAGQMVNGLASHVRNVLMAQQPQTVQLIEASEAQQQRYAEQAKRCKPKFLYDALKILNQCDVSYRLSSNKRLLVELTLIQVAQITQEEAEAPGVGRRPCKRLKSLFKKIMGEMQSTVAAQVATTANTPSSNTAMPNTAAAHTAAVSSQQNSQETPLQSSRQVGGHASATSSITPAKPAEKPRIVSAPKVKLASLSGSFSSIMSGPARKKQEEHGISGAVANENERFTDDDLRREWLAMCNRMMQSKNFNALATRMHNIQLRITEYPKVEAVCENQILFADIQPIMPRIQVTMATYLHNGSITITPCVSTPKDTVQRLSPAAFKQKVMENHPDFASFYAEMQLELEM